MTSGFGVDPTKNSSGVITSGTSSSDLQNIWGALYSSGPVSGCLVHTSSTDMTYKVDSGVVMIPVAVGKAIPAPVPASTVPAAVAPTSGSRTDYVYAQQRFPSIEGDSEVIVLVGAAVPVRAVQLGKFVIPAGATTTSGASSSVGNSGYSIPYGGSLGVLHQWTDMYSGIHDQSNQRMGYGVINLPTDRLLRVSIQSVLWANGAAGFDNSQYCEWYFRPEIDNNELAYWGTPGLHQAWATYNFEGFFTVSAGTHTMSFSRGRRSGPGQAQTAYGTINGDFFPGTTYTVLDAGVAR